MEEKPFWVMIGEKVRSRARAGEMACSDGAAGK